MSTIAKLHELRDLVKAKGLSALQCLSSISAELTDLVDEKVALVDHLSNIVTECGDDALKVGDEISATLSDELDYLKTKQISLNTSANSTINIYATEDSGNTYLSVNGDDILAVDNSNIVTQVSSDINLVCNTISRQTTKIAAGTGAQQALADIASLAASGDWTEDGNLSNALYSRVDYYKDVLGYTANDLITSISNGPEALSTVYGSLVNKVSNSYESQDLSGLLASTDLTVNSFAWGAVASAIGTVISAIGIVVSCFSRVVGAVVAIAGLAIQALTRIVLSATTAFDDTHYKLYAGCNVTHCFAFVIDQAEIEAAGTAAYMRSRGWDRMTVICPYQGLVYMMYLDEFDSTSNLIHYETHLSSDVDLTDAIHEYPIDQTGAVMLCVKLGDSTSIQADAKPACPAFMPTLYNVEDHEVQEPYFLAKIYGDGGTTFASARVSLRNQWDHSSFFYPIEFTLFDKLKEWYNSDLNDLLDVRLCSALILYLAYKFNIMLSNGYSSLSGNDFTLRGVIHTDLNPSSLTTTFELFMDLYELAWHCFWNGSGFDSSSKLKSSYGLTQSQRDMLITRLSSIFNTLAYKNTEMTSMSQKIVRVENSGQGLVACNVVASSGHDLTVEQVTSMISTDDQMFASMKSATGSTVGLDSGVWQVQCAVQLPTLTFTGFIAGLIVDGLIIAAAVALSIVAVVTYVKILNKRSQLQAKVEASWYNYQDNQDEAHWKDFKKARFKYNLVALCTGGTRMSMGLYDEDASSEEIISSIKGFIPSSEPEVHENNTISSVTMDISAITKLIKG